MMPELKEPFVRPSEEQLKQDNQIELSNKLNELNVKKAEIEAHIEYSNKRGNAGMVLDLQKELQETILEIEKVRAEWEKFLEQK